MTPYTHGWIDYLIPGCASADAAYANLYANPEAWAKRCAAEEEGAVDELLRVHRLLEAELAKIKSEVIRQLGWRQRTWTGFLKERFPVVLEWEDGDLLEIEDVAPTRIPRRI
jgi:hypothetical protein